MKRPLFSNPEEFSLSPLLALLPVRGKVGRLEALTSSLFARYEKVASQLKEPETENSPELKKRFSSEEAMLRQVLEWLEVSPKR